MPIEFRCSSCGKLLRVGDDAAGRQVQCPACKHIGTVPVAAAGAGAEQNPFAPLDQAGPQPPPNPFQSPTHSGEPPPNADAPSREAARRLAAPAIGLIIACSFSTTLFVCLAALYAVLFILTLSGRGFGNAPPPPNFAMGSAIFIVVGVLGILRGGLLIVGAVKMKNLDSYGLALTAAILAVIPCFGCWPIEAPFGVWALVVLNDPFVRAHFAADAPYLVGETGFVLR